MGDMSRRGDGIQLQSFPQLDFEGLRKIGDPLADEILDTTPRAIQEKKLMHLILRSSPKMGEGQMYNALSLEDAMRMERIRCWFGEMMPFSGLILLCGSLPAAYSAAKGATVLRCTGRMQKEPRLRIMETSYFLHEIFEHSYVDRDGDGNTAPVSLQEHPGFQAVVKVRLLHAKVRRHILKASAQAKPKQSSQAYNTEELGVPVNQEDMMGTLTVFSYVLLLGFERLGIRIPEEQREDYAFFWNQIGQWIGVQYSFKSFEDQSRICQNIFERHCVPDEHSKELVQKLFKRIMPAQLPERRKAKISRAFCTFTHMLDKDLAQRLELEVSQYHLVTWTFSVWMFKCFLLLDFLVKYLLGISIRNRGGQAMGILAKKVMKDSGIETPFDFRVTE